MRRRGMSEMNDLTVHDKHDAVTVSLGVVLLAVDADDDEAVRTTENGAGTSSLSHLPPLLCISGVGYGIYRTAVLHIREGRILCLHSI